MKKILLATLLGVVPSVLLGQSAIDAYQLSQGDLKGTARFVSMGGAFGALGGDLSTLNQNPAGIGVYRSSEIGVTMDINMQSTVFWQRCFQNSGKRLFLSCLTLPIGMKSCTQLSSVWIQLCA